MGLEAVGREPGGLGLELRSAPRQDCAEATASLKQPGDTIKVKDHSDHGGEALGGGEEWTRGGQSWVGAGIPVGGGEDRGGTGAGWGEEGVGV